MSTCPPHLHTAAALPLENFYSWFFDILAYLIHQKAVKTVLKLEDKIHYFRPLWVKEEAIVNACCNA